MMGTGKRMEDNRLRTEIIYEDGDILVCNKPAGLAVQSGRISEPDMVSELKNHLSKEGRSVVSVSGAGASVRCGIPGKKQPVYLGVIHRLDQPVSGLLVFAKNQRAAAALSGQVAQRRLEKIYRAKVYAEAGALLPENESVVLKDYMIKLPGGGARIAELSEADAKEARLEYRCLGRQGSCALVEVNLDTGRHHQIRVQMANAGMPLLGDAKYGSEESRRVSREMGICQIQLQAAKLSFVHPSTGKRVEYELTEKLSI